jgi:hypothetical protein
VVRPLANIGRSSPELMPTAPGQLTASTSPARAETLTWAPSRFRPVERAPPKKCPCTASRWIGFLVAGFHTRFVPPSPFPTALTGYSSPYLPACFSRTRSWSLDPGSRGQRGFQETRDPKTVTSRSTPSCSSPSSESPKRSWDPALRWRTSDGESCVVVDPPMVPALSRLLSHPT